MDTVLLLSSLKLQRFDVMWNDTSFFYVAIASDSLDLLRSVNTFVDLLNICT